jgi:hypothetical protein
MSDRYVTLLGAEQVQSAANTISSAASDMRSAANIMDDALRSHRQFLDDWLDRFAQMISPPVPQDVDDRITQALGGHGIWTATALRAMLDRAGLAIVERGAQ